MIPLKDNIPSRGWPVANWIIIGLCIFVFLGQIRPGPRAQGRMIERFGLIPVRVLHPGQPVTITERAPVRTFFGVRMAERSHVARRPPFNPWLTLLTCIFLHAGWLHLLGNMWFLFVFG
ncbi:MAG: rhomboid family intramembrane serine protease, partial [bacterium]|nr:rhomboid family intramembrane serine protease [bacterium]